LTILAAAVIGTAGFLEARWTHRWSNSTELAAAVEKLAQVPMDIGDWRGQPLEMDARQLQLTEASGYVMRRYENKNTGRSVTILLLCGRPGPIAVHPPEVCYQAIGWKLNSAETLVPTPSGQFRAALFTKGEPPNVQFLRVLWGWKAQGTWEVPANPRLKFAGSPVLYKLYVVRELGSADERLEGDPSTEFLGQGLPVISQCLLPVS
jgi:hypothetical protein